MIVISAFLMAMVLSACGAGNSVQAASKDPVVHTETNGYGATANRATEVRDERVGDGSGLLMGLSGDLTQEEVSDLLYMREEEKLARVFMPTCTHNAVTFSILSLKVNRITWIPSWSC